MSKTWLSLILILLFSVIGVIGDFFLKLAGNGSKTMNVKWFIIGFLIYSTTAIGWFYIMKNTKLVTLSVFYSIITILLLAVLGFFYFNEKLQVYEIIGIIMAILSMILLGRFA